MANPLLTQFQAAGVETESTIGTAETIVAADCFRALEPTITINDNPQERTGVTSSLGRLNPTVGGKSCDVSFGWEVKNSGTAGSVWNPVSDILKACGFTASNIASFSDTFTITADPAGNASTTFKTWMGAAVGSTAKSKTAAGVRYNLTVPFNPGEKVNAQCDGQGVFAADADDTVLAASGEPTQKPVALKGICQRLLEYHADNNETIDGVVEGLRDGAASNIKLARSFTQGTTAQKVGMIRLPLALVGSPQNETNGVWITIEGDSAGDPDGTPITNGTSAYVATTSISSTQTWVNFTFTKGSEPTLSASTDYWIVFQGDYDTDASNHVSIDTESVGAGAQDSAYYDAAWAALALKNLSMQILVATDPNLKFGPSEFNMNNVIELREDPCASQGWESGGIVDRHIQVSLTPEEMLDANWDLGDLFDDADELYWECVVGTTSGNIVEFRVMHGQIMADETDYGSPKARRNLTLGLDESVTNASCEIVFK